MDAEALRAYKKRWELVEEIEQAEQKKKSFAQKFADVAMLMEVARGLSGNTDKDEEEVEIVRARWNLLAERSGV